MSDLTNEFERFLYNIACRKVNHAIEETLEDRMDSLVPLFVDKYVTGKLVGNKIRRTIKKILLDDSEVETLIDEVVKPLVKQITINIIQDELEVMIHERLEKYKIGDRSFADWLVNVALKQCLTSEAVVDSINNTVDSIAKARIEEIFKSIFNKQSI